MHKTGFLQAYTRAVQNLWTMAFLSFLHDNFFNYHIQDYLLEQFNLKHIDFERFNFKNLLLNNTFVDGVHARTKVKVNL